MENTGRNSFSTLISTLDIFLQVAAFRRQRSAEKPIYAAAQQPVIFLATEDHVDLVSNRIHGVAGFSDGILLAPDALFCSGS